MALPLVIEYLLSRKKGNGSIVNQSISHTIIPSFPANTMYTFAQLPGTDYATIIYESMMAPDVMPHAFDVTTQYSGSQFLTGTVETCLTGTQLNSFLIISNNLPAYMTIRNRTNVPQYYAGIVFFLSIKSEIEYKAVIEELDWLGSKNMGPLALQANSLLTSMAQRLGVPRPPEGGS